MRYFFIFCIIFNVISMASSQKHDYNWVMGYEDFVDPDPQWGGLIMDFNSNPPTFHSLTTHLNFRGFGVSCSDSMGNLLFYSNGIKIHNKQNSLMENGDTINPDDVWENFKFWGAVTGYGGVVIPAPGRSNCYYMFHMAYFYISVPYQFRLYYTLVDMNANAGLGRVLEKNIILLEDVITPRAVKHGNGRDWWLITGKKTTSIQYVFLIDSTGIHGPIIQDFGPVPSFPPEGTIAHVSPDGSTYIRSQMYDGIRIYDFNRCTGEIGNLRFIPKNNNMSGGIFSPDSRMVYLQNQYFMGQVDLMNLDTSGFIDTIAYMDGSASAYPPFYTYLGFPQHGPDGKIYLNSLSTTYKLHTINRPDLPGAASDIQLNGVSLPRLNAATTFNIPYYRLGEWEQSPCDTINLQQGGDDFYRTSYNPTRWTKEVQGRRRTIHIGLDNDNNTKYNEWRIDPLLQYNEILRSIQTPPPTPWKIRNTNREPLSIKKSNEP